ncbi:hypothetical protein [Lysobacter soli]|uniref:hypothetical protein n=1 Tax=Lysobacter soli TaxID=453783 RepID=UPI0011C034C8|nr:hypothetical protein [Lysobacter soli]
MFSGRWPGWSAWAASTCVAQRGRGGAREAGAGRGVAFIVALLLALACASSPAVGAPAPLASAPIANDAREPDDAPDEERFGASSYFSATPQLRPLRPLAHLPPNARARVHAAVATAPDPWETRLGRSFDMEMAAMITAFQARGYVLDGFALAWHPRDAEAANTGRKSDADAGRDLHREIPGVMLFRRDGWRSGGDVEYYAVFLVGDSQTFGVEPAAFARAARCALLFNGIGPDELQAARLVDCDLAAVPPGTRERGLDIIGPSFSGSMQSMAVALGNLCNGPCDERVRVTMLSPSASVGSNRAIVAHPFLARRDGEGTAPVEYHSLARNLATQVAGLLGHLCRDEGIPVENVTILAEESTFGGEALRLARHDPSAIGCGERLRISARQFPPNIASIRAEHSILRGAQREHAEAALPATRRLLELDMGGAEAASERPPVYQPSLTSRSDELMLYRGFDTMKVYRTPNVVVIVATDIRDRLFLLGEVRKALPGALPVMVELDFLAVHPDYRKASRGAVVLAAGEPVACLSEDGDLVACRAVVKDERCHAPRQDDVAGAGAANARGRTQKTRFPFATDHAANTFRAVVLLDEFREGNAPFGQFMARKERALAEPGEPVAYVATMAGFQGLGRKSYEQRSLVAVADVRLAMQEPAYLALMLGGLFFVVAAVWLWLGECRGRVMLPFLRGLVSDFRATTATAWRRWRHGRRVEATPCQNPTAAASLQPACRTAWLAAMTAVGAAALVIATRRLAELLQSSAEDATRQPCYFMLAHGRDLHALACIWLLYAGLCIVAYMRLNVSNRRYAFYNAVFTRNARRTANRTRVITGVSWAVPVVCGLAAMGLVLLVHGRAVSIDNNDVWWIAGIVLATGLAFLVNLFWQVRLLGNLSLSLARTIAPVQAQRAIRDWPKPSAIREAPQTPFNLSLREYRRDMPALLRASPRAWAKRTLQVMRDAGTSGPDAMNPWQFERWTEQLVAELKLCVVPIRTCAWCAMLAPVSVLVAMSVYPPVYERLLTSIAIMLLLLSFAATILVVLRLEKDAMLGLMFTNDGNTLTFGGALRALWPKFVAMGLILVPLAAPDVWSWMYGLVRSINSFG